MSRDLKTPESQPAQVPIAEPGISTATKDLIAITAIAVVTFVLSYYFNIFNVIVRLFQHDSRALTYIDEIITFLVVSSLGFAAFSFRRWQELKQETAQRMQYQTELIEAAETKATVERIISRQLRSDMEDLKHTVQDIHRILTVRKGV